MEMKVKKEVNFKIYIINFKFRNNFDRNFSATIFYRFFFGLS